MHAGERPLPDQERYRATGENCRRRCWKAEAVPMRVRLLARRRIVDVSRGKEGLGVTLKLCISA